MLDNCCANLADTSYPANPVPAAIGVRPDVCGLPRTLKEKVMLTGAIASGHVACNQADWTLYTGLNNNCP